MYFKVSTDVCQLRLDFQTFSGFAFSTLGAKTDSMAAAGQTGVNPPSITGTNTGYHSKSLYTVYISDYLNIVGHIF